MARLLSARQILLAEFGIVALILLSIIFSMSAISIAYDIHQSRLLATAEVDDLKRQSFRRFDDALWKADTALQIAGTFKLDLASLMTSMRAQVKKSTDESSRVQVQATHAQQVAITQALEKTTEAVAAVAEQSPEKVAEAARAKPVTVNVPPPSVVIERPAPVKKADPPPPAEDDAPQKRWYRVFLWPFKH